MHHGDPDWFWELDLETQCTILTALEVQHLEQAEVSGVTLDPKASRSDVPDGYWIHEGRTKRKMTADEYAGIRGAANNKMKASMVKSGSTEKGLEALFSGKLLTVNRG